MVFPPVSDRGAARRRPPDAFGMPATRADAIRRLAGAVATGEIDLSGDAELDATLQALRSIKGIGTWTADYIAMRALGDGDAFLVGDLGVREGSPPSACPTTPDRCWSTPSGGGPGAPTPRSISGGRDRGRVDRARRTSLTGRSRNREGSGRVPVDGPSHRRGGGARGDRLLRDGEGPPRDRRIRRCPRQTGMPRRSVRVHMALPPVDQTARGGYGLDPERAT